jgi:hypothetical protein
VRQEITPSCNLIKASNSKAILTPMHRVIILTSSIVLMRKFRDFSFPF